MSHIERLRTVGELASLEMSQLLSLNARLDWFGQARPDQLAPSDFFVWLLLAGRGSGKTRAGAEEMWFPAAMTPQRVAVIGPTSNDVRKTCFEGESGLLAVIPPGLVQSYNRTSLEMWLRPPPGHEQGSYFVGYSAEEPERLRGPQHHRAWCDELAAWRYLEDTWDMMLFGLRLGQDPNVVVTTTPKPVGLLRELIREPDTLISRASMYDNSANLPVKILEKLRKKFEGTRLGRQELYAEILDDNPFALWQIADIDGSRVKRRPTLRRVVVAVDPPASSGEDADECGTVVAGVDGQDRGSEHGYVLADRTSQGLSPEGWATEVVRAYDDFGADAVVAEVNNGGDMVESVIRNVRPNIPVIKVHATRGKVRRAEPVSMLYEQERVHHVGRFGQLEDQMCDLTSDFNPRKAGYSPDRVDALVWGLTELMVREDGRGRAGALF